MRNFNLSVILIMLLAGKDQEIMEIRLHPATITAREVVISGGRYSTQHDNAIKIELLKGNELLRIGSPTLIESLVQHDFENDVHLQVGFRFDNRSLNAPSSAVSAV